MDTENKRGIETPEDFGPLETNKFRKTESSRLGWRAYDLCKLYVGADRRGYFEFSIDRKTKGIILPVEAWTTMQAETGVWIENVIKNDIISPTALTERMNDMKRADIKIWFKSSLFYIPYRRLYLRMRSLFNFLHRIKHLPALGRAIGAGIGGMTWGLRGSVWVAVR